MRKSLRLLPFLIAVGLPLWICALWHSQNHIYPYSDEGLYFSHSQNIQLAFESGGLIEALRTAYLDRTYKGILHPILAAPALITTDGNAKKALAITLVLFFAVFLSYFYGTLKLLLPPWRAAIGTLIVGSLSGVLCNTFTFNGELPMVTCVTATIFHFFRGTIFNLSNRHITLSAVWLALGICVRPVEVVLLFWIPVFYFIYSGFRQNFIHKRDILTLIAYMAIVCAYTLFAVFYDFNPLHVPHEKQYLLVLAALLASVPAVIAFFFRRKLKLNTTFIYATTAGYLIFVFWLLPYLPAVFEWAYTGSFGQVTVQTGNRAGVSYLRFLAKTFTDILGVPFVALCIVGLLGRAPLPKHWHRPMLIMGIAALAHPIVGGISYNGDTRYYAGSGVILYGIALIFALFPTGTYKRVRPYAATLIFVPLALYVALIFLAVNASHIDKGMYYNSLRNRLSFIQTKWTGNTDYPFITKDPLWNVIDEIRRLVPSRPDLSIALYSEPFFDRVEYFFHHHSMNIIRNEHKLRWKFFYTYLEPKIDQLGHKRPDVILTFKDIPKSHPMPALVPNMEDVQSIPGYSRVGWFYFYNHSVILEGPFAFAIVHVRTQSDRKSQRQH